MITTELTELYHFAWHPGDWMTDSWWEALNLKQWQETYKNYPICRLALNKLIIKRRGFPLNKLPVLINEENCQLLHLRPRLNRLLTGIGLIALGCKDYLLLGNYRCALRAVLGEKGCDPLLLIGTNWHGSPTLAPEDIAFEAQQVGIAWLASQEKHNMVWHALSICLPFCNRVSNVTVSALPTLFRVAKFL